MFIMIPKGLQKIKDPKVFKEKFQNYIQNYGDITGLLKETSPTPRPKKKIKSLLKGRESGT